MATILFPDLSVYRQVSLAGAPFLITRATIGIDTDPTFNRYKQEAADRGILFVGYHFLKSERLGYSPEQQAQHAFNVAGRDVPIMMDAEPHSNQNASVGEMVRFIDYFRSLGGKTGLAYIPRWSWQQLGSPDLAPLRDRGMALVSSNYTQGFSEQHPGWAPYGGYNHVTVLQYTDKQPFNGQTVDFNAFRGDAHELYRLAMGPVPVEAKQANTYWYDDSEANA